MWVVRDGEMSSFITAVEKKLARTGRTQSTFLSVDKLNEFNKYFIIKGFQKVERKKINKKNCCYYWDKISSLLA